MRLTQLLAFFCILNFNLLSNDSLNVESELTEEEYQVLWKNFTDSLENTLDYEKGEIEIKDIAIINIPAGYKYLNPEKSEMILTDIWGNPPSPEEDKSLGMLIPSNNSPFSDSSYVINITYTEDGYIDDKDASNLDYNDLLNNMQDDTDIGNEYRIENGYLPIELVGWASPPFYDSENKKLHWAKELKFGDTEQNTLNYNIRILGRKGYLQLNAIGEMYILNKVTNNIAPILSSVDFTEGSRYGDFNPDIDKIAAYGIGGLIAGKVLMKAGILAKVGILLAKFWKVLLIGFIGLAAGFRKFFSAKEKTVPGETLSE